MKCIFTVEDAASSEEVDSALPIPMATFVADSGITWQD